jgi:hypothetical protein
MGGRRRGHAAVPQCLSCFPLLPKPPVIGISEVDTLADTNFKDAQSLGIGDGA